MKEGVASYVTPSYKTREKQNDKVFGLCRSAL